jgi:hypothetical protein
MILILPRNSVYFSVWVSQGSILLAHVDRAILFPMTGANILWFIRNYIERTARIVCTIGDLRSLY